MSRIAVGIIGFGFMGEVHLKHYKANPAVGKIAVVSPVAEEREKAQRAYDVHTYDDYEKMLIMEKPDVVSICAPNYIHAQLACASMDAGAHVLLEKPIGIIPQEVDAVIRKSKETGKKVMVGHSLRFSDAYSKGRDVLLSGKIGEPVFIEGKYKWFKDFNRFPGWKKDFKTAGGGMLLQSGIHIIDMFTWYVNSPVKQVWGLADNLYFKNCGIEDSFIGAIRFESGVMAHFVGSNATKGFVDYGLEVYGTDGAIKVTSHAVPGGLDITNHTLSVFVENHEMGDRGALIEPAFYSRDFWANQINSFLDYVVNDTPPPVCLYDAQKTMDVCFALYESAKTRNWVSL